MIDRYQEFMKNRFPADVYHAFGVAMRVALSSSRPNKFHPPPTFPSDGRGVIVPKILWSALVSANPGLESMVLQEIEYNYQE